MPRLQPSSLSFEELLRQRDEAEAQRRRQEEFLRSQQNKQAEQEQDEEYYDDEEEELDEESIPSQEEDENENKLPFDIAEQRAIRAAERARQHEDWVTRHANDTRFDHETSKTRAQILIAEARRNEMHHLQHQLRRAKYLLRKHREARGIDASPCASPAKNERLCSCCVAPVAKQLTAKFRAMVILRERFGAENLEEAVETLRQTYNSDHEMLDDLTSRYGPEPADIDDVDPELRVVNVQERLSTCDQRWKEIGRSAMRDMQYRDNFPTVIRNLSIMRIFLEGSQAGQYGCDMSERSRRDAQHQAVLDRLSRQGQLFETPEKKPAAPVSAALQPSSHHAMNSSAHGGVRKHPLSADHSSTPMARKLHLGTFDGLRSRAGGLGGNLFGLPRKQVTA